MIDEWEANAEEHMSDAENDGKLHLERVGEGDRVVGDVPDGIDAERIGAREVRRVRVERHWRVARNRRVDLRTARR